MQTNKKLHGDVWHSTLKWETFGNPYKTYGKLVEFNMDMNKKHYESIRTVDDKFML